MQHLDPHIQKAIIGGIATVVTWVTGQTVQAVESIPDAIKAADTPLIVGLGGFAIHHLWKAWQNERKAREADTLKFIEHIQEEAAKSAESRGELILAVERQTVAAESATTALKELKAAVEANRPLYQNPDKR